MPDREPLARVEYDPEFGYAIKAGGKTITAFAPDHMAKFFCDSLNAAASQWLDREVKKVRAEYICSRHNKMLLRCLSCEEEAVEADQQSLRTALELIEDLRGYCREAWDWKYKDWWDEETAKVKAAIHSTPVQEPK